MVACGSRILLFVLNGGLCALGIFIAVFGPTMINQVTDDWTTAMIDAVFNDGALTPDQWGWIAMGAGIVIAVLGALAVLWALCGSKSGLMITSVVNFIFVALNITLAVFLMIGYQHIPGYGSQIEDSLKAAIENEYNKFGSEAIQNGQLANQWTYFVCANQSAGSMDTADECFNYVSDELNDKLNAVGIALCVVAAFQLLVALLSCHASRAIGREQ